MDMTEIAKKLGISESKQAVRRAAELRRLSDLQFDSSILGAGENCKAITCLEIAATRVDIMFDCQTAINLSGMSKKAYITSFNAMQNGMAINWNSYMYTRRRCCLSGGGSRSDTGWWEQGRGGEIEEVCDSIGLLFQVIDNIVDVTRRRKSWG